MRRTISPLALLLTSVSAILGSGWLFSAYYTAKLAGPGALLSWLLGGLFVTIIAFVFAEICGMLPITGSSARIPQFTHGSVVSFMFAWMIWLSYLALMATEVQAVIQYLSFYLPQLTKANGGLTVVGYFAAGFLMLLVSTLNTYSLRWLIRSNSFLTILKVVIPIIIVAVILIKYFAPQHILHPVNSGFLPNGMHGVFAALSTGGIVFAFNGFKQAAEMAGEARRPHLSVPFAIVGSVGLCLILFLFIQVAFFSSLNASNLFSGWSHLTLSHGNSPLASIIEQDHVSYLLPILYIAAIIAPLAASLMYCGSAARSIYAMSKNGYIAKSLQYVTPQGSPAIAIIVNFLFGLLLFAPLPGWNKMAAFLASIIAITYAIGPICLVSLRFQVPEQKRPLKLPLGMLWSYIAFYLCTLLAYWSGWDILSKLGIALTIGLVILLISSAINSSSSKAKKLNLNWRASVWIWPYFIGLSLFSYLGNFGNGRGILTASEEFIGIALFCLIIFILAVYFRLPNRETQQYINELRLKDRGAQVP